MPNIICKKACPNSIMDLDTKAYNSSLREKNQVFEKICSSLNLL